MSGTARRRRIATASVAALSSLALLTGGVDSAFGGDSGSFHPGAVSKHDRIVPGYGNGGYDVLSYDIHLHYNPDTGRLHGHTRIEAVATASLSRFHLDFVLPVGKVTVDGRRAKAASRRGPTLDYGGELVVTPKAGLPVGHQFTVVVRYDAHPADIKRQGYSSWSPTPTGSTAWNEPQSGPQWWYPSDDYPDDKATYDVTITAPKEDTAVSNGVLVSRRVHGGQATAHWSTDVPMATYLTFLTIGRYDVRQMTTRDGIPAYFAFERGGGKTARRARHFVSQTPRVIRFLERRLGPYPFPVTGAILERTKYATAFETQTRVTYAAPLFASDRQVPGITNVVHETAHQWFGDDVTAARWGDIWLAEGFASYAQWLWSAAHHKGSVEHHFKATYQRRAPGSDWWHTPVVDNVDALALQGYRRGAMSLEALRNVVGSRTFFAILRTYLERYRYSSVTTADFTDVAEELSPTPLGRFFQVWLYSKHRPKPTVRNGFPAGFPGSVP